MSTTPTHITAKLQAAGWRPVNETDWQRPGPHPDIHSWVVADFVLRTGEPHHAPPPALAPKPPKPGFQMRGSNRHARPAATAPRDPRPPGQPRKADLILRVATMHDEQRMTFAAIAAKIGGKPSRAHYLYRQTSKLQPATTC